MEQKAGDEHIKDADGCLRIYVPMDKKAQDISYGTTLPNTLAHWLMRDSLTQIQDFVHKDAVSALTLAMTMERSALDRIFQHQGINHVPILDEDELPSAGEDLERHGPEEGVSVPQPVHSTEVSSVADAPQDSGASDVGDSSSIAETLVEEVSVRASIEPRRRQQEPVMGTNTRAGSETSRFNVFEDGEHTPPSHNHANFATDPTALRSTAVTPVESGHGSTSSTASIQSTAAENNTASLISVLEDGNNQLRGSSQPHFAHEPARDVSRISTLADEAEYRALLNNIVVAARGATDPLPQHGTFDMSAMRDNLPGGDESYVSYDGLENVSRIRSSNQFERDKKVGAAGELFVSLSFGSR